jgi:hypothetical protein
MKRIFLVWALLMFPFVAVAQINQADGLRMPGNWNGFTNSLGMGGDFDMTLTTTGIRRYSTRFEYTGLTEVQNFKFASGGSGNPWANQWYFGESSEINTVSLNVVSTFNWTTDGGVANSAINVTNGKWYTVIFRDSGYNSTAAIFMETSANPVVLSAISTPTRVFVDAPYTVTLTLAGTPSAEERFYLRYTTDNYVTSNLIAMTVDGTTATAQIPGLALAANVNYYAFSSTVTLSNDEAQSADIYSIRFSPGGEYTVVVDNTITTAPTLSAPEHAATNQSSLVSFSWGSVTHATRYRVEIASDAGFDTIIRTFTPTETSVTPGNGQALPAGTTLYWRVRGENNDSNGAWSDVRTLTTQAALQIFYTNPNIWSAVKLYAFTESGVHLSAFPGDDMTAPASGSKWYSAAIPPVFTKIIFSNGSGSQTGDLIHEGKSYYFGTTWYAEDPLTTREVTFTVNMTNEIDLGRFNTSAGDKVYVLGQFNNFQTISSAEMQPVSEGSTSYTLTTLVGALTDTSVPYKFRIIAGDSRSIYNSGWEHLVGEETGTDRTFSIGSVTTGLNLGSVHFNNGARTSFTLSGSQGWRFMSSPFSDRTYVQVLSGLHTQGFTGATFVPTQNAMSNLFTMNNASTQGWVALTDGTVVPTAGNGFVFGVFGKDDPSDASETWPKTRTVTGTATTGTVQVSLNDMEKFTLAGNPFLSTVDYSQTTRVGLSDVVYVYDYVTSDFVDNVDASSTSGGMFRAWNGSAGSLGSYRIAPFQGFLVYRTAETASFAIPEAAKTSTAAIFRGKEAGGAMALDAGQASVSATSALTASLEISGNGLRSSAWLHFAEEASAGLDSRDAFKLYPFSSQYALLQTYTSDGVGLDINHHPVPGATTVIALDLETTVSGTYTLRAGNWQLPDDWTVVLRDTWNGAEYRLDADAEVTLAIEAARAKVRGGSEDGGLPGVMQVSAEGAPRFALVVTPGAVTSVETGGVDVPRQVELYGNYPNPFNPVTQIQFALPVEMPVRLEVFDMLGRRVAVLHDGLLRAGTHTMAFQAGNLGSGVYVYRLEAGGSVITRKMTLMK